MHEPPDPEAVESLVQRLAALEVAVPPLPELPDGRARAAFMARWPTPSTAMRAAGPPPAKASRRCFLRSLQLARYDPRNAGHAGLASRAYCHFTSPIRRYPDLVCHRALLHRLGAGPGDDPAGLGELAVHTSAREREAAAVERRGTAICLTHLLHDRLYELGWEARFDGVVTGVAGFGAFIRFAEVFDGLLPVRIVAG